MTRLLSDDLLGELTTWLEGRGESFLGQTAIGEVIRNRTARRLFSDGTVVGTVFRSKQFSCWNDGDPNRVALGTLHVEDPSWHSCQRAWAESATSIVTKGATHYLSEQAVLQARGVLPSWAADPNDPKLANPALVTLREGRHTFFKL